MIEWLIVSGWYLDIANFFSTTGSFVVLAAFLDNENPIPMIGIGFALMAFAFLFGFLPEITNTPT